MGFPLDGKVLPLRADVTTMLYAFIMVLSAGLIVKILSLIKYFKLLSLLPQPKESSMLLGHRELLSQSFHRSVEEWLHTLGGIIVVRIMWLKFVFISDPWLVDEVLAATPADGMERDPSYKEFESAVGHATVFTADSSDPYWKIGRKNIARAFSVKSMREGFPSVLKMVKALVRVVEEMGGESCLPVDVQLAIKHVTLDVTGAVLFDMEINSLENWRSGREQGLFHGWVEANEGALNEMGKRTLDPVRSLRLYDPDVRKGAHCIDYVQKLSGDLARTVRSRSDDDQSPAGQLARMIDPGTGKLLSDKALGGELNILLTAGTDTSSLTTAWTLFLVSQHPEVEAKIVEELRQHGLLACQQHTNGRDPTFDDLSQLHYLNAVIKESMRLKPVAAYTTARVTTRDVVLGGRYHLPAGTSITVMGSATYRDPALWDRPAEFVPERWLEGNPEFCSSRTVHAQDGTVARFGTKGEKEESSGTMPRQFFPFSLGHRDCVGRNLGNMMVATLLTVLYANLTFRLADEMGGVEQVEAGEVLFFTLSPGKSLKFNCFPRT